MRNNGHPLHTVSIHQFTMMCSYLPRQKHLIDKIININQLQIHVRIIYLDRKIIAMLLQYVATAEL
jgi:hypothetical protein